MKLHIHAIALAFFCAVTHGHGQGTMIVSHLGAADPTTEGFSLLRTGNPSLTPLIGDYGLNTWGIGLSSDADIALYKQILTAAQAAALSGGWTLTLRLRIAPPFSGPYNGISAGLATGAQTYSLVFGAQANGDPVVAVRYTNYPLNGLGSGYHTYQLKGDAGADFASLWVDGTVLLDHIAGDPNPSSAGFSWGGSQHAPGSSYANWNEASLSVIPEPSGALLFLLSAWFVGWCGHGWGKRR